MTIDWDCDSRGCFKHLQPDWAFLDDCFPRGIKIQDIDGTVEFNGKFLSFEWKSIGVPLKRGQIAYWLTKCQNGKETCLVISGDSRKTEPMAYQIIGYGKIYPEVAADKDAIRGLVSRWVDWTYAPF